MHLSKLDVQNFRGFGNISIEFDDITVLVGENNTGKTSLLSAIQIALARGIGRKGSPFEDQDFLLNTPTAKPGDAGPLVITLEFCERKPGDWDAAVLQTVADVLDLRTTPTGDLNYVTLRITSNFDNTVKDFVSEFDFLNARGMPIPKGKRTATLIALQQLNPVFYLSALRDTSREFGQRSPFWSPFLRNPAIPPQDQQRLELALQALNDEIIRLDTRLAQVRTTLSKAQDVVSLGQQNVVNIEALPTRVWDLLSRAQVNIAGTTGANLPLSRHGAGTQSLAVIFLFEAFLQSGLGLHDKYSEPILTLEEPEAHLHPCAVRTLWSRLEAMGSQTIVATHSGDLLSQVPLRAIRRLRRAGAGRIELHRLKDATLSADELRKINFHIRRNRAELLFARCWLMGEGETEYWVFSESARIAGIDLEKNGVRILDTYAQVGAVPFVKVANDLGIQWHCVVDGDVNGQDYKAGVAAHLLGRLESDHVTSLTAGNMEVFLCESGFGDVYEANVSPQKRNTITLQKGQPGYWAQVVGAQSRAPKGKNALETMELIEKSKKGIPKLLKDALDNSVQLAGR